MGFLLEFLYKMNVFVCLSYEISVFYAILLKSFVDYGLLVKVFSFAVLCVDSVAACTQLLSFCIVYKCFNIVN